MKKILVSQRVDEFPDRNESRDAVDQKLIHLIMDSGLIPIQVPNLLLSKSGGPPHLLTWIDAQKAEGIVLSGGNECPERDETENFLLDWATKTKVPVLGICNGMQRMGTFQGSKLMEVKNHVGVFHQLKGEITGLANSYHNFAFKECPDGFRVAAVSEDGIIEAIIHNYLPWEGWMWHPERDGSDIERDMNRIKKLFNNK